MTPAAEREAEKYDVAVIGAGPVGLFAVFACGQLGMRCCVLDSLEETGGQCTALYPDKPIYDVPAYAEIGAGELIRNLEAQIKPFGAAFRLGSAVTALAPLESGGFALENAAGARVEASAVIIAAGVGAFGPNRPPLNGLENYEGKSVFYHVERAAAFAGKRIVIAGGGDSALDWTMALADKAAHIMLVHRRAKFRGAPASLARVEALVSEGKVELVTPYVLSALEGESGVLRAVEVKTLSGDKRRLEADCLLAFFGLASQLGPVAKWGLAMSEKRIAVDAASCVTSTPGVFAIGDVVDYPGKLKLILTGFAEAEVAAHAIYPLLHGGKKARFVYSTTQGKPEGLQTAV